MGKKNKKESGAASARRWRTGQLNKNERKAMERYGLDTADYGWDPQGRRPGQLKGDYDDMRDDFMRAASNDYDTRRALEASAMSGKKKAQELAEKGFRNPGDVMNANNLQRKQHARTGHGGDFSSLSDFAGLTYNMVQRDRRKLLETVEDMQPEEKETPLDKAKDTFKPGDTNTLSPEAAKSAAFVQAYEDQARAGTGSTRRFGSRAESEAEAAKLAEAYKDGVKQRLSPDFRLNKVFS